MKGEPICILLSATLCTRTVLDHSCDYDAGQDAYDLIDALSAYDVIRGLRLSFTGYNSFIQTNNTESTENTEVELSVLFPTVQKASLPAGLKELTT